MKDIKFGDWRLEIGRPVSVSKNHVTLRERGLRPKSLLFGRERPFAIAQGDMTFSFS